MNTMLPRYLKSISTHKSFLTGLGLLLIMLLSFVVLQSVQAAQENTLGSVESVNVAQVKKHQIKLTWAKVTNADQYQILLLDESLTKIEQFTTQKNNKTIKELTEHTKYYFQVRAVNSTNTTYGEWSEAAGFYTKPYRTIAELPAGIVDNSLPTDVRMYKNTQQAENTGAMKLAMGGLYDDLETYYEEYALAQETVDTQSTTRNISSERDFTWINVLSHRARELGQQNVNQAGAESVDDPHIQTFDGLKYDNQARGIFWLMKDDKAAFSVQALQRYVEGEVSVSYNSGLAVQAGEHTVIFNLKDKNPVSLDGTPLNLVKDRVVIWPGVMLMRHNDQFFLITEQDQSVFLKLENWLNPEITINRTPGDRYSGLLGNENGIPYDDLSFDTTVGQIDELGIENRSAVLSGFMEDDARAFQIPMATFYDNYIEPWSVASKDSYFEEIDYIDYLPPAALVRLDDFTNEEIQTTREKCLTTAGLAEANSTLFDCVYDHLTGGLAVNELASIMKRRDGKVEPTTWIDLQ